jgi:hypothetical protein
VHGRRPGSLTSARPTGSEQRTQALRDRLASPEDPGPHGSDRTIHHFGDLFVAEAFDFAQRDRLPQLV